MATLQSVIDRAISVAVSKGSSSSKRITVVNEIAGSEIMIVVSYNEPSSIEAPINLIWVDGDPASLNYKLARKRASRVASAPFTHTWLTVTTLEELATQFWDTPEPPDNDHNLHDWNIDNVHRVTALQTGALPLIGGELTGAVTTTKVATTVSSFTTSELVSRSWVELFTAPIQLLAAQVKAGQAGLLTQFNSLRNRVTALENRLRSKGYVHTATQEDIAWGITHGLNSLNMNISVFDSDGYQVIPSKVMYLNASSVLIEFAVPTKGYANLQAVII